MLEELHLKTHAEKELLIEFMDCFSNARELLMAFQHPFLV